MSYVHIEIKCKLLFQMQRFCLNILILLFVLASPGVSGQITVNHWETIVFPYDIWSFLPGSAEIPANWKNPGFDLSTWQKARGGIGYGDGDDIKTIDPTISLFMRLDFDIEDKSIISGAILNADYDDAFVAYLNGIEIARSNIGSFRQTPAWDEPASTDHEAAMYNGGNPEAIQISAETLDTLLHNGSNTFAIEVHNRSASSSDLSSIFYFTVGITVSGKYYKNPPEWFYPPFESSNLPLMLINTNGQSLNPDERIIAEIGLMDYTDFGKRNYLTDTFNIYEGRISIRIRGSSSLMFPKKNYIFETQDETGENRNVELLGLPKENDWVLHGPYSDKTLIRNVLSYHIASTTGRYAPRTRWIELLINNQYQGLYVLTEKIKQDKNRVDIAKLNPQDTIGDQLTGGYIIQMDRDDDDQQGEGWYSKYRSNVFYNYYDPGYDELVQVQKDYIKGFMTDFEDLVKNAKNSSEFISSVDIPAFVDYWIPTEIFNDVDGYKLSFYMYKDLDSKGGKLQLGPVWDLNLAYGNYDFTTEPPLPSGWTWEKCLNHNMRPFWVYNIVQTDTIQNTIACRWQELRAGPLQTDRLMQFIDDNVQFIEEARLRNFQRWPVLGIYVWPNYYVGANCLDEVNYLKDWLETRMNWMDENMLGNCFTVNTKQTKLFTNSVTVFPNPFSDYVTFSFGSNPVDSRIEIYNSSGIQLQSVEIEHESGYHLYLGDLSPGIYFYRITSSKGLTSSGKMIKQ